MGVKNGMRPVHPGEVLRDELDELGMSASALSKALGVPVNRVTMILNGQRGVSADTALRLGRYFGTTPQLWMNLQKTWELRQAEITNRADEIAKRVMRQAVRSVSGIRRSMAIVPDFQSLMLPVLEALVERRRRFHGRGMCANVIAVSEKLTDAR